MECLLAKEKVEGSIPFARSPTFMNNMNKKVKILLVVVLLGLAAKIYSSSEMHFPFYPYIDTIFAKDFSRDTFNQVEKGMTQEKVKTMLGEPFDKTTYDCWKYSTDGKLSPYADFSWYLFQVCFKNGVVDRKPINEFND